MTCKKEEECFSAPDLVENTSGRERGSFLFMYRYLSKSHWMRCVGSLERGDCLCIRVSISKVITELLTPRCGTIEQLTRIKGHDQTSERGHQKIKTSDQNVSQILSSSSVHCLPFVCLFIYWIWKNSGDEQ